MLTKLTAKSLSLFAGVLVVGGLHSNARAQERSVASLAGVTAEGHLWHTTRASNGAWTTFNDVEAVVGDIGTPFDVSMAYTSDLTGLHLIATNVNGDIFHTLATSAGWTPFGNIKTQTGNPGSFSSTSLTEISGALHVVGITTNGTSHIWHAIRQATGVWTGFSDIEVQAGDRGLFMQTGVTSLNGELHVCGVTTDNHLWHTVRHTSSWEPFRDVELQTGDVGAITDVDCTAVSGNLHVVVSTSTGGIFHAMATSSGWTGFGNIKSVAGNPGFVKGVSATQYQGALQVAAQADWGVFHAIRASNGSWTSFGNVELVAGERGNFFAVGMD